MVMCLKGSVFMAQDWAQVGLSCVMGRAGLLVGVQQQKQCIAMSSPHKIRKRISFTPIMLTSKAIRPVQRSDYEVQRNQRKFSGAKHNHQELTNYLLREEQTSATHRQSAEEPLSPPPEDDEEDRFETFMRRMATPTVVRVEFNRQGRPSRRKAEEEQVEAINEGAEATRSFYYTNAKTFEQFSKMNRTRQSRRLSQMGKEEVDEEWKKYLDKYYLSIKKVKPLSKGETMPDALRLRPPIELPESLPRAQSNEPIARFHSNTRIRSLHKKASKQQSSLHEPIQEIVNNSLYKQIEKDITTRRAGHRKDFFVFGMSDNAGKIPEAGIRIKLDLYRDFLFKVNFTNGLYVRQREVEDRPFKAYVGFGNNAALIKGILRRRFWWQIVEKPEDSTNFVWSQLKMGEVFKGQHRSICKFRLRRGLKALPEAAEAQAVERAEASEGTKAIMTGQDLILWENYLTHNAKYQQRGIETSWVRRVGGLLKKKGVSMVENSGKLRVHNHFQANYFLGNKKALFYSLKKYYELKGQDPFRNMPLTFHICEGLNDPEFDRFVNEFARQSQRRKADRQFRNVWILKPGELTNCGRGITVCSTLDEIKNRLRARERNGNGSARTFIVQKYIERPLLYWRRKFDLRHYMVVTCAGGKMKAYWYSEGYVRTSSSEYNIRNTKDALTHLTNDAVQKHSQDYGKYEKGNKLSYSQLQKYLNAHHPGKPDLQGAILPQMKQLAADCTRATYALLDPDRKEHNFELFGLDYMLDEELRVHLIEVNTNPALDTSCPLLTKIITPLVENTFRLCLDPLFPPPNEWPAARKYPFGENPLEESRFSLIFDEGEEGAGLKELYQHTSRIDEKMGDVFEEEEEFQDQEKEWSQEEEPKK